MIEKSLPQDNNKYQLSSYGTQFTGEQKIIILKEIKSSLKYDGILA